MAKKRERNLPLEFLRKFIEAYDIESTADMVMVQHVQRSYIKQIGESPISVTTSGLSS